MTASSLWPSWAPSSSTQAFPSCRFSRTPRSQASSAVASGRITQSGAATANVTPQTMRSISGATGRSLASVSPLARSSVSISMYCNQRRLPRKSKAWPSACWATPRRYALAMPPNASLSIGPFSLLVASSIRRSKCSGVGQQFIAYGIHPDTGKPYEWPASTLAELDMDELPAITEAQAREFAKEAYLLIPIELRPKSLGTGLRAPAECANLPEQRGTLEAVEDALRFIINDDLDYDSWVRVGMAMKGALGDDGWPLFEAWSANSQKNEIKTTAKSWRSFAAATYRRRHGVQAGARQRVGAGGRSAT